MPHRNRIVTGPERWTSGRHTNRQRLLLSAVLLMLPFLAACNNTQENMTKRSDPMYEGDKQINTETTIPPIDAAAPAQTETATFAMG